MQVLAVFAKCAFQTKADLGDRMTRNKIDAKRSIQRAPNLTDDSIHHIVGILDGWTGTLTWDALIEVIAEKRFTTYTRQALHKHERIRSAFKQR